MARRYPISAPYTPCHPMATITFIVCDGADPDEFEAIDIEERRRNGGGWETFDVKSGVMLCTFLMGATHHDFGVFGAADEVDHAGEKVDTAVIFNEGLREVLPILERLVETERGVTVQALYVHGGCTGDMSRITEILRTGEWPTTGDAADEAAAFAFHLLAHGRTALAANLGVCWEYRGEIRALLTPPPTDRRRELETLYAQIRTATLAVMAFDMGYGKGDITPEELDARYKELSAAQQQQRAARESLDALIARTRTDAPAELDAWAFAHYCYLSQFLHQRAERGDTTSADVLGATREREQWARFRAGTLPFVDDSFSIMTYFYRAYFGIDALTLERVDPERG